LPQAGLPNGGIPFINGDSNESEFTIIVGGSNFGCGSSREHAPFALKVAGAKAVIAESYARIYYRNSVDGGFLLPYETPEKLNDKIKTGDELEINLEENIVKNLSSNESYELRPLSDILPIIEAGDIFEYARQNGMIAE
jgi:3-isopropylmalate/(R)-2-methylmalate dehydratase small subunit